MKKKVLLIVAVVVVLLSIAFTGCGGGIPQADYDALKAQLADVQSRLTQAQADKSAAETDLSTARASIADLQKQLADLQSQGGFTGATKTETVTKLIKYYYETHTYLKDIYDCNNMSDDIWDMLKALGISSRLAIGNVDQPISDILASNHAWVMADIGDGNFLALETTNGLTVTRDQNPLYYTGWYFTSPDRVKANDDLKTRYNAGVEYVNTLVSEINSAINLYNNASSQAEADKYYEVYSKLKELKATQENNLLQLKAQIEGLATKF